MSVAVQQQSSTASRPIRQSIHHNMMLAGNTAKKVAIDTGRDMANTVMETGRQAAKDIQAHAQQTLTTAATNLTDQAKAKITATGQQLTSQVNTMVDTAAQQASARVTQGVNDAMGKAGAIAEQQMGAVAERAQQLMVKQLEKNPEVQKAMHILPDEVQHLENRVGMQLGYAAMTLLGPLAEPLEAGVDAVRDAEPTLKVAQDTMAVAIPILQMAEQNGQSMTLEEAAKKAGPVISQGLQNQDMPVAANLVTALQSSPTLQQKMADLHAQGKLEDANGDLTDEAVNVVNVHARDVVKAHVGEEHHATVDATHAAMAPRAPVARAASAPPTSRRATKRQRMSGGGGRRSRRRKRLRNMCPPRRKDGLGLQLMNVGGGRARYRWVTRIRPDGRMVGRAAKMGVSVSDLCFLRPSDFGPERLLAATEKVRTRPSQTRRVNSLRSMRAKGVQPRPRRYLTKRHRRG